MPEGDYSMSVSAEQQLLDPPLEQEPDPKRFYGVTTGRVINLIDPMFLGRVQVQLPFIDCLDLNPFARVATPMTGELCGMGFFPQVGDEVLVAFEQGDPNVPYIIGSLWNALAPPVLNFPVPDSPVRTSYTIRTLTGNQVVFVETPPTLTLQNGPTPPVLPPVPTPGAYQTISLTPAGIVIGATTVVLTSLGVVQLTVGSNVVTISPEGVTIASAGELTLTGATGVNITSPGTVTITGSLVAIN
jgi:Type VI secretion system/phage-baseplate injector OB domain